MALDVEAKAAIEQAPAVVRPILRFLRHEKTAAYLLPPLVLAIVLPLWEWLSAIGFVHPIILPPPSDIGPALWKMLNASFFPRYVWVTVRELLTGYVLGISIGFSLGVLLTILPLTKKALYPYIVVFQSFPKIILAPLFITWLGFGMESKVAIATIAAFFPTFINTMGGLSLVPEEGMKLMKSLTASTTQIFFLFRFPNAIPTIFIGLKISLTFALVGTIVSEFIGAKEGLGYLVGLYNYQLQIPFVYAVMFVLAAMGLTIFFTIEWADKRIVFWRRREGETKTIF